MLFLIFRQFVNLCLQGSDLQLRMTLRFAFCDSEACRRRLQLTRRALVLVQFPILFLMLLCVFCRGIQAVLCGDQRPSKMKKCTFLYRDMHLFGTICGHSTATTIVDRRPQHHATAQQRAFFHFHQTLRKSARSAGGRRSQIERDRKVYYKTTTKRGKR